MSPGHKLGLQFCRNNGLNCKEIYFKIVKTIHWVKHKMSVALGTFWSRGVLGSIFAGYVPLASKNPYPIIGQMVNV